MGVMVYCSTHYNAVSRFCTLTYYVCTYIRIEVCCVVTYVYPWQQEEVFPFRLHGDHDDMRQFLRNSTVDFVKG